MKIERMEVVGINVTDLDAAMLRFWSFSGWASPLHLG
jgi:hypothetical protein